MFAPCVTIKAYFPATESRDKRGNCGFVIIDSSMMPVIIDCQTGQSNESRTTHDLVNKIKGAKKVKQGSANNQPAILGIADFVTVPFVKRINYNIHCCFACPRL
jgi:hypothetical protein